MILKATATGLQMAIGSFITTTHPPHASRLVWRFMAKLQIAQVTQPPYSPDLVTCNFWPFPSLKSPLKGMRFRKIQWGSWRWLGEPCEVPMCLLGDWGAIVLYTMFLVSPSMNVSIFNITWLDTFLTDLICGGWGEQREPVKMMAGLMGEKKQDASWDSTDTSGRLLLRRLKKGQGNLVWQGFQSLDICNVGVRPISIIKKFSTGCIRVYWSIR